MMYQGITRNLGIIRPDTLGKAEMKLLSNESQNWTHKTAPLRHFLRSPYTLPLIKTVNLITANVGTFFKTVLKRHIREQHFSEGQDLQTVQNLASSAHARVIGITSMHARLCKLSKREVIHHLIHQTC